MKQSKYAKAGKVGPKKEHAPHITAKKRSTDPASSAYNTGKMSDNITSEANVSRSFKQIVMNLEDAFNEQVFNGDADQ